MEKTRSLRKQIFILMAMLVALQSIALVLALFFSQVFSALDAESFRIFTTTSETRAGNLNRSIGEVVGNLAGEASLYSARVQSLCAQEGISPQDAFRDDTLFEEAAAAGAESVLNTLRNNNVTGAFVVYNGSNADKNSPDAHSAVYIRNSSPGSAVGDYKNYQMEIGPAFIARDNQIAMSTGWALDIALGGEGSDFYYNPAQAAAQYPRSELERYGYWTEPGQVLRDGLEAVCYTLPLLDSNGDCFGVMGVELALTHLSRSYLSDADLPYQNSFYLVAKTAGSTVDLDWFIPSGPAAQAAVPQGGTLALRDNSGGVASAHLDSLGEMYCSLQKIRMYSDNSPFYEESWTLVSMVEASVLHDTSRGVRRILMGSILITTITAFGAVFFLTWLATKDISQLPRVIRSFGPRREIQFKKTGTREIDELTSAIETLNRSVINSYRTTSKILELTSIPMGGFELPKDSEFVMLTGFVHDLLHVKPDAAVTVREWELRYALLCAEPAEGYDNVYRYTDTGTGRVRWLRICQEDTESGRVGSILDVTEDVERNIMLAHELDYDALTHLYSRSAFHRKVMSQISREPGKIGAMIFADLDNLKYINDNYGHDIGDRFLIQAGEMFASFSELGGIVSRISGDEFAIYLHGYDSKEEALRIINKQFDKLRDYSMSTPDGEVQRVRSSAGVALYPSDSDNVTDLLKLSDFAMYDAKRSQKGALFQFNRQTYWESAYLLDNREAINRLIDEALIRFAFQPIVSLHTGEVYGYEALMRPLLDNFASPQEILTVAADQSKLGQLERLVMLSALQFVHDNRKLFQKKKVFVNSISGQLLSREDVLFLSRRYQAVLGQIVVEITEDQQSSLDILEKKAQTLRGMGARLAIDDFGAGYSNELRILSLNPDIIKIDMAIIQGIHQSADRQQLVSNILSFCSPRGIQVIAEGVEQEEDLDEVRRLGVDYVQGYLTGRPSYEIGVLAPEVTELLRKGLQPDHKD